MIKLRSKLLQRLAFGKNMGCALTMDTQIYSHCPKKRPVFGTKIQAYRSDGAGRPVLDTPFLGHFFQIKHYICIYSCLKPVLRTALKIDYLVTKL